MSGFPFQAVLWDVDGTLADSEPVHQRSFADACTELGLTLPGTFHAAILGKTDEETYEWLVETCGLDLPFDAWNARRLATYLARIDEVNPVPEAIALWHRQERLGVVQAVVSNSDRLLLGANLERIGLAHPGLISVSRNDVLRGKPDPEPYRRAMHLLRTGSGAVAVVEDSATGSAAARAAGAKVFMMPPFEVTRASPERRFEELVSIGETV